MSNNSTKSRSGGFAPLFLVAASLVASLAPGSASAGIDSETGPSFTIAAREGYVSMPDGASLYSWGYTMGATMQLPGPTLRVTQGDTVTVQLTNALPYAAGNTSIVFPGHTVTTTGGVPGSLTQEAETGGTVTYTFVADTPGTYQYHSGSQTDLQVEMGMYGALIVDPPAGSLPAGCTASAYAHDGTCYDREYLFLISEMDLDVHQAAELQSTGAGPIDIGEGPFLAEYWMINGRAAPDTMAAAGTATLPTQPYNSLPQMHPGERLLARLIGAGRDLHPFHHHGNHMRVLARDGRLLVNSNNALSGPDLFTIPTIPGGTVDAVFEWTGKDLGWDMYGHTDSSLATLEPHEDPAFHGKPIPVDLPDLASLTFGGWYSGSPFLGALGALPPGEGGLNPDAGFAYMWHSHNEREQINNDIFPGGMLTMLVVLPWDVVITN